MDGESSFSFSFFPFFSLFLFLFIQTLQKKKPRELDMSCRGKYKYKKEEWKEEEELNQNAITSCSRTTNNINKPKHFGGFFFFFVSLWAFWSEDQRDRGLKGCNRCCGNQRPLFGIGKDVVWLWECSEVRVDDLRLPGEGVVAASWRVVCRIFSATSLACNTRA